MRASLLAFAATLIPTTSVSAQDSFDWTTSISGGSRIEVPEFMTDGWVRALMENGVDYGTAFEPEAYPVQLRQYRTKAKGRPFEYLATGLGTLAEEVTYTFDEPDLGAISGYTDGRSEVFYAMCKLEETVVCFDMHWPTEAQMMFGPIAERIAKGFRTGF